jgi:hypothetical protein
MANLLADLRELIVSLGLQCETGVLSDKAPATYIVLTPIQDVYNAFGEDIPLDEVQEVRISLFTRTNYRALKRQIETVCINARLVITGRRYIGREDTSGYFHYAIDVANCYFLEEE